MSATLLERPLSWTADPPDVPAARHLAALRMLLLAHFVVQGWVLFAHPPAVDVWLPRGVVGLVSAALTGLLAAALAGHGRAAALAATPLAAALVAHTFPLTPNHTFLAFVLVALCALLDPDREDEGALLLQALRWIAVLIFFWAGVQKALHGLYFRGEFLTWMIAHGIDRWAEVFGWLAPDVEIARVRALPHAIGVGPYRLDAPLFLVAANLVWIGEIVLALGMLLRPLREWAALAAIGLVFTIQLAPREFMFAMLYTNLLLLFVRGEWNWRLRWLFLAAYAYLLAAALMGAPGAGLLKPETLL